MRGLELGFVLGARRGDGNWMLNIDGDGRRFIANVKQPRIIEVVVGFVWKEGSVPPFSCRWCHTLERVDSQPRKKNDEKRRNNTYSHVLLQNFEFAIQTSLFRIFSNASLEFFEFCLDTRS